MYDMNKFCSLLMFLALNMLLFVGCGKEEEIPIDIIEDERPGSDPNDPNSDIPNFMGYYVEDTTGLQEETALSRTYNDTTWIFALRNEKAWFGMFDERSKKQLAEWQSQNSFSIKEQTWIAFNPFILSDCIAFFLKYPIGKDSNNVDFYSYDVFLLKEEKAISIPTLENISGGWDDAINVQELENNELLVSLPYFKGYICSKEGEELVNSVLVTDLPEEEYTLLTGFKDEKAWIRIYNNNTDNKSMQEYIGEEVYDRNKQIYQGYGEYENIYVECFYFGKLLTTNWGYVFVPSLQTSSSIMPDLFICKDGKMKRLDTPSNNIELYNWYEDSFLVYEHTIVYTIYSSAGELILQESKKRDPAHPDPFWSGNIVPISYSSYIWTERWGWGDGSASLRIRRYDLNSYLTSPLWQQEVANIPSSSKVTWILLDNETEIWTYMIDILHYDGSKQQIKFSININTGDLKML